MESARVSARGLNPCRLLNCAEVACSISSFMWLLEDNISPFAEGIGTIPLALPGRHNNKKVLCSL